MRRLPPRLKEFSQRGMNLFGSLFHDDVRVVVSRRAKYPATVVLESRTVVLHPDLTGLFDLALCAELLNHRALRKLGPEDEERKDRWLTLKAHRKLVPEAYGTLQQTYPGIVGLSGKFRPGHDLTGLHMVVRKVEWTPLGGEESDPMAMMGQVQGLSMQQAPSLETTGDDDFNWLLSALENGKIPTETLPGLEELPFVRVPFQVCLAESFPTMELFEEMLADEDNKELIASLMKCYQRKSEVRQDRPNLGKHTLCGTHLNSSRLVDAVLANRTGREARLFRRPAKDWEPLFDPSEHLVVINFDMNDLKAPTRWTYNDSRRHVHRFLACLITTFQRLEVDCVVQGFADQIITLNSGRHVCLHLTTTLKTIQDRFDDGFWHRLSHLLNQPPQFPGEPTCFHPLSLGDITRTYDEMLREYDHSYRAMNWWARRGMSHEFPKYRQEDFMRRVAAHLDHEIAECQRRYTGTFDTLASYLPDEIRKLGEPGGYLNSSEF